MGAAENKPEVRCGIVQHGVKGLELLDPTAKTRILDRYPRAELQAVVQGKENDWILVTYDIRLFDCIKAEVTEEEYIKVCKNTTKISIESSLLGPFVRSALHLFKISPKTLLKAAPLIWNSCYRNCGKVSVNEKGTNCVQVLIEELPQVVVENRNYLTGIAVFIQALGEFTETNNVKVVIENQSKITRSAAIVASWDEGT